jgi:hypothetical protein
MALIPTTQANGQAALSIAFTNAAPGGDTFAYYGSERVLLKAAGTPRTVTFTAVGPCNHGFLHDAAISVPANTTVEVKKPQLGLDRFANPSTHIVTMTYDSETGLSIAVLSG